MDAGLSAIAGGVAVFVVLLGLVAALFVLGRSPAAQVGGWMGIDGEMMSCTMDVPISVSLYGRRRQQSPDAEVKSDTASSRTSARRTERGSTRSRLRRRLQSQGEGDSAAASSSRADGPGGHEDDDADQVDEDDDEEEEKLSKKERRKRENQEKRAADAAARGTRAQRRWTSKEADGWMDGWMDGCVSPSLVLTLFFIHANTEHKAAKAAQYDARRREKEAAREAAELAEEEERRRAEEEREAADQKEYEQWRGAFSVEEQGQSLMQTRAL